MTPNEAAAKQVEEKLARLPQVSAGDVARQLRARRSARQAQLIADGARVLDPAINPDEVMPRRAMPRPSRR